MRKLLVVAALVACGGGGGKGYSIVQPASPNPFKTPGCKVSVDAVAYDKLVYAGQPEADRVASMPADQQARFQDDKKAFSFALKQELVAQRGDLILDGPASGANQFLMKPSLVIYSPGDTAELVVDITDAAGTQVLEELRASAKTTSLREASGPLGRSLGHYLKARFCSH